MVESARRRALTRAAFAARFLSRGLLDLVLAPECLGCGAAVSTAAAERLVCVTCWSRTRALPVPACARCGSPTPAGAVPLRDCAVCPMLPPSLRAVRSAFQYEAVSRRLVRALKYGGWRALAAPMAERMAALPLSLEAEEEVRWVVPVPLAAVRLRERGYNQAEELARNLARRRGWSHSPELLERHRPTDRQTALHAAERRANVAGAFRVPIPAERALRGEHLLLVDDVWTTGATALACTEALLAAGARAVSVLTFARALPELRA